VASALAIQFRNWYNGKSFADMRNPMFWIQATGASGVTGMWGDYITGMIRQPDQDWARKIGGPLVSSASELFKLAGTPFGVMDFNEKAHNWTWGEEGVHTVDFLRKNMIPQPFFVGQVLQRDILEPMQAWMAPKTMKQRFKSQRGYQASEGTPYQPGYGPGTTVPLIPRLNMGQ